MRAVLEAAMEPAEDQPDDADVTVGAAVWQFQPQWNQPRIGWMTRPVRAGHVGNRRAAMEPAKNRPDDDAAVHQARRRYQAAMEPAENRLEDGRVLARRPRRGIATMEPTEDRLGNREPLGVRPVFRLAVMKPAQNRLDDSSWRWRDWCGWTPQ